MSVVVVVVICASCAGYGLSCANHSLQSYFSQKEFFGELLTVFRHLNMDFTIFFDKKSDLSRLSLSFKTKT